MSKNPLVRNGEEKENMIRNSHADPDHHRKSITSRRWSLVHVCQVHGTE